MSIKRVLAATDGSRHGDHAVLVAEALAKQAKGTFALLAVDTVTGAWEPSLQWWNAPAVSCGTATLIRGLPGIEIVHHAESWKADLVVLGRHDHTPERPLALGPTSDAVIRRRNGLSLFVPKDMPPVRNAVIAIDGSLRGLRIVASAVSLLNLTQAKVHFICVLPGERPNPADSSRDPWRARVSNLIGLLKLASGPCQYMSCWGEPVGKILEAVRGVGADLLVLGVRRGGKPGELGSGCVGRRLLESAPCAVLTVPI
jgi:nucleotide-binding universal stress UspA family protein